MPSTIVLDFLTPVSTLILHAENRETAVKYREHIRRNRAAAKVAYDAGYIDLALEYTSCTLEWLRLEKEASTLSDREISTARILPFRTHQAKAKAADVSE